MDDLLQRVVGVLDAQSTTPHRRQLAAEAAKALSRMSEMGLLEGLVAVEVFGSFASPDETPGDVDLLLEYDDLDADTARLVDELYGPSAPGPVGIVAIDAGPEGDAFRDEYRTETMRRHGAATVRIVRDP